MLRPISWHKETLENQRAYITAIPREIERLRGEIERLQKILVHEQEEAVFYEQQITQAIRQGKSGFDRERFLRKISTKAG